MVVRLLVVLSVLNLFGGVFELRAQDTAPGWFYRAWQTEDGLPDNSIADIAQTPDGYLWIATNGGAMRFNGTRFDPLPLRDIPELPSRQVRAMTVDRKGQLWLGMERGPLIRIGESGFHVFARELLNEKVIMSIVEGVDGQVWVAYPDGVCLIEGDEVTRMKGDEKIPVAWAVSMACDVDGQVWLANDGQLGRLSREGFEPVRDFADESLRIFASLDGGLWLTLGSSLIRFDQGEKTSTVASLPDGCIANAIFENNTGAIWIGTQRHGLLWFKDGAVKRVGTSHAWVECIAEDQEGYLWAGTRGGGLNLVRPRAVRLFDEADGMPFSTVRSTACDAAGRIWAVSDEGILAFKKSGSWQLYTGLGEEEFVNCVATGADGRVWVGTRNRGVVCIDGSEIKRFRLRDGLASMSVRSLLSARNGDVWIATDSPSRLHRLRGSKITQLEHTGSFSALRAVAELADGTVWAGSADGRLFRVEGDRMVDESALDGALMRSVRTMQSTPDGSLWIGYAGDGLGHLKDGRFRMITTDDGLHDNYISQILDDGEGGMWLAANRGLFEVELEDLLAVSAESEPSGRLRCSVFGPDDGVPSIQPSRDYAPAASRDLDGHLYFPTGNGIVDVDPSMIRENTLAPPVMLEKVSLDNQLVAIYKARSMLDPGKNRELSDLSQPAPSIELPPGHEKLVVTFAALSLASPEKVQLRYRLKPRDKDWEEIEGQRSVTFSQLPAGSYEFQVIACNNAGVWNEVGVTLAILVRPFFWETWWFKVGAGLLTAGLAGGLVFLSLRRKHRQQLRAISAKQALEKERSRIARDIHDDLGASLTRITLLSQSGAAVDHSSQGSVLDQIHTTSRHLMRSMEEVVWAVNPEHDTFDALANYLCNYAQGFLGIAEVRCRLEMPMALPEQTLSAQLRHNLFLAFKEALNNAVKHAEASEVRVSLKLGQESFSLKVEDNGKGIDPNATANPIRPSSGSGLANMRNRMDEIGGTCTLNSTLGNGTAVEFEVPFKI